MEALGKKLQQARLAKGVTLDEAARMTKIRPSRLQEIEGEDFSQFPSLAYAKGFLQIYGKFLEVDVTPYLDAFETSKHVTVDGYSYLQDNPVPAPARAIIRRSTEKRAPLLPLLIGAAILVAGLFVMKLVLDIQRIAPPRERNDQATAGSTPSSTPAPSAAETATTSLVAPRALPVDDTPPPVAQTATAAPAVSPVAVATPPRPQPASPSPSEPEVRRAEPVHPEDLARLRNDTAAAPPREVGNVHRVEIKALKKTYIKVTVDNYDLKPAVERWIAPGDAPVQFRGQHIAVKVLDRGAVEIRKNGKPLPDGDADVTVD